jgi:putative transposase
MSPGEKITRRHLPHWFVPGAAHFVTFRLADSLPAIVLAELRERKELLLRQKRPDGVSAFDHRARAHKQLFAAYDGYLDSHVDVKWLADERIAALVRSALYFHNHQRYHLHAYVIMPNHVHVLFEPILNPVEQASSKQSADSSADNEALSAIGEQVDEVSPLSGIMHSLKSFTAHRANQILQRKCGFWQHESYDHWVRNEEELERIVNYIGANPVNAGLAARPRDWIWGSAHDRLLWDGETTPWLGE